MELPIYPSDLSFAVEDIREVVIPNEPDTVKIFEGAPFKVIVKDGQL